MKVELIYMDSELKKTAPELTMLIIPLDSETDTFLTGPYFTVINKDCIKIYMDNPILKEETEEAFVLKMDIIHSILSDVYFKKTNQKIDAPR